MVSIISTTVPLSSDWIKSLMHPLYKTKYPTMVQPKDTT